MIIDIDDDDDHQANRSFHKPQHQLIGTKRALDHHLSNQGKPTLSQTSLNKRDQKCLERLG